MVMANIWCCACVSCVQATNDQSFCFGAFDDPWWWWAKCFGGKFQKWMDGVQNKMVD